MSSENSKLLNIKEITQFNTLIQNNNQKGHKNSQKNNWEWNIKSISIIKEQHKISKLERWQYTIYLPPYNKNPREAQNDITAKQHYKIYKGREICDSEYIYYRLNKFSVLHNKYSIDKDFWSSKYMFGLTLIWQNHGYHGFWQNLHFEASTKNMH